MDFEKLDQEIEKLQDELSKTDPTSEDYNDILDRVERLSKARSQMVRDGIDSARLDNESRELDNKYAIDLARVEADDKRSKREIAGTVFKTIAAFALGGLIRYWEDTDALRSKGMNFVRDILPR